MDRTVAVNGITLIELLIAAFLVGLVGLAVTSVDISARRFMFSSQQDTGVQNEAGQAVAHIMDNAKYGWDMEAGIFDTGSFIWNRLCFRIDEQSSDGIGPFNSDGSPEGVDVVRYRYTNGIGAPPAVQRVLFYRLDTGSDDCSITGAVWGGGGWEMVAQNIPDCTFTASDTNGDGVNDRLRINITAETTSLSGETKTTSLESDVTLRFTGYKI